MNARLLSIAITLCVLLAACGSPEPPPVVEAPKKAEPRPSVFDPWVGTIDRAKGVQNTVDDQAAAQRKLIEQQER